MIIKHATEAHFVKRFNCGARSARKILPGEDRVRVKVTHLFAPVGAEWVDISYPVDETVIIVSGKVEVIQGETKTIISTRACYVVQAGEIYTLKVLEEVEMWCVFSQAGPCGERVNDE